jgi:hypothetical protein
MKSDANQIEGEAVSKLYSELESLNNQKKKIEATYAGSIPIDLEVKYDGPIESGLYFLPFSIAASISFV